MPILPLSGASTPKGALVSIAKITLTSNTSGIGFTNIPQIFTDLVCVVNINNSDNQTGYGIYCQMADGSTNYSFTAFATYSSPSTSFRQTRPAGDIFGGLSFPNDYDDIYSNTVWYIGNYRSSNFKTILWRNSSTNLGSQLDYLTTGAGLWGSTSPVTNFTIRIGGANSIAGSTAELFGVRSVNQ